jgi:hypothetical protein
MGKFIFLPQHIVLKKVIPNQGKMQKKRLIFRIFCGNRLPSGLIKIRISFMKKNKSIKRPWGRKINQVFLVSPPSSSGTMVIKSLGVRVVCNNTHM